jgi:hypothetical protein
MEHHCFRWLAVWVLSPDGQCCILKRATVNRRLGEAATPGVGGGEGAGRAPSLHHINPVICLTTEENHGKPQSGHPKNAWLISSERDSFSRLGHRLAMVSTSLLAPPLLAFASGDGVNPRSA